MAAAEATYGATAPATSGDPVASTSKTNEVKTATDAKLGAAAPLVAEFVGTFMLVLTAGFCGLAPAAALWAATAVGLMLMAMTYSTAMISGGHLNPAVSFSLWMSGNFKWGTMWSYWAVQVLAGTAAGAVCKVLFAPEHVAVGPKMGFSTQNAFMVEMLYSAMLCFIAISCGASRRLASRTDPAQTCALAVGLLFTGGGYAAGPVSGALFNPALAFGFAVFGGSFRYALVFSLAHLLGGLIGASFYRFIRFEEHFLPEAAVAEYKAMRSARFVAELAGTFSLVLTAGLNGLNGSLAPPWSVAAVLMAMTYSLGDISGAHLNPAVTVAVVVSGRDKCSVRDGGAYVVAQVTAAILAGFVFGHFQGVPVDGALFREQPDSPMSRACVAEVLFTFSLVYAVLATATTARPGSWVTRHNSYAALAIGACVMAGGLACGSLSGGRLNPAVSAGLGVGNHIRGVGAQLARGSLFSLCNLIGGLLAVLPFRLTHRGEFSKPAPLLGK